MKSPRRQRTSILHPSLSRLGRTTAAGLLLLTLTSCFTMGVWGVEPETERNPRTGRLETVFRYQKDTRWSWGLVGGRILLTPLTLCLDCITLPIQAFLFDDDDC